MNLKLVFFLGLCAFIFGPKYFYNFYRDTYVPKKVVQLVSSKGSCSGIHVDIGDRTYILSASHCLPLQNDRGEILVKDDEMSEPIPRRVLDEDENSDLILLEALPGRSGLDIADNAYFKEKLYSYTHGRGYATHKTEGSYIQNEVVDIIISLDPDDCDLSKPKYKIIKVNLLFFELSACALHTDSMVSEMPTAPGSSGGPVVNKYGDLVGIVFAGGGGYSFFVTLTDIQNFVANWK